MKRSCYVSTSSLSTLLIADIFDPARLQKPKKKKNPSFELQLLGCHTTLQARVCACPFEAQGADHWRHMEVGVVRQAGRRADRQSYVTVKEGQEALLTIWSPF